MKNRRREMSGYKVMKALRLEYSLTLLLAFCLYFFISENILSTSPIIVTENTTPTLFSTETQSPIKTSLLYAIDQAKEKITLLIYSLSDRQILTKLQQAALRGVDVTVIADPYSASDIEHTLGSKVHTYLRKPNGLMHLKIFVIDKNIIWLGSANMSTSSLESHGNLCSAIVSKTLSEYIERFAQSLIATKPFEEQPVIIQSPEQKLTLFMHPFQGDESLTYLVKKINTATKRVFVAMYTFTNKDLVNALLQAQKRGVTVRAVFDKDSAKNTSKVAFQMLQKAHIPVGTRTTPGLLHHKFALIDDSLAMGSCNWTKAGFFSNCDCILWFEPLDTFQENHLLKLWQKIETASTLKIQNSRD